MLTAFRPNFLSRVYREVCLNTRHSPSPSAKPFTECPTESDAAESTGRICYGMDIDSKYVDVAVLRWQRSAADRRCSTATGGRLRRSRECAGGRSHETPGPMGVWLNSGVDIPPNKVCATPWGNGRENEGSCSGNGQRKAAEAESATTL